MAPRSIRDSELFMRLNDDFTKPAIAHAPQQEWVASPSPGVERKMLFRVGNEKAYATSLVRYAPGSRFPPHLHTGGEEFLVLDGVFQDEHGDYPAGTYVRNPPGTSHTPTAESGATIFVRLWQFRADDREQLVVRPGEGVSQTPRDGATTAWKLFDDGYEQVLLEGWEPNANVYVAHDEGLELLVVRGAIQIDGELLAAPGWLRLPKGIALHTQAGNEGAKVWMKLGPALHPDVVPLP